MVQMQPPGTDGYLERLDGELRYAALSEAVKVKLAVIANRTGSPFDTVEAAEEYYKFLKGE